MIRAVVFDLDYTLAVPEEPRERLLVEATRAADAPPIDREEYLEAHRQHLTNETREPIFSALLAETGADADPSAVTEAYREAVTSSLVSVHGVEDMLESLRERYTVGLLTDGPVRAQHDKLAALGWENAFDAVVVTGALEAGKPDPRAFEAICDALDVEAGQAVYVGDDVELDVLGAKQAGMGAIQVTFERGPDSSPDADAHVERSRLADDLPGILTTL